MATVGSLVVNLLSTTKGFTPGVTAARKDLQQLAKFGAKLESDFASPAEKVRQQIIRVNEAWKAGAITQNTAQRALQKYNAELQATSPQARFATIAEKERAAAIRRAAEESKRAASAMQQTNRAQGELARGGGKSTLAMLELSRAAEDAAVGFSLDGLRGAVRGAANNVVQFLSVMGPAAGVIAGFGAAALFVLPVVSRGFASLIANISGLTGELERADRKLAEAEGLSKWIDHVAEATERVRGLRREYDQLIEGQRGAADAAQRKDWLNSLDDEETVRKRIADAAARENAARRLIEDAEKRFPRVMAAEGRARMGSPDSVRLAKERLALEKQAADATRDAVHWGQMRGDLQERLNELEGQRTSPSGLAGGLAGALPFAMGMAELHAPMLKQMQEAQKLRDELKSPREKFVEEMHKLEGMRAGGLIDPETFRRGTLAAIQRRAAGEESAPEGRREGLRFSSGVEANSREAFDLVANAVRGGDGADAQQKTADNTAKLKAEAERISAQFEELLRDRDRREAAKVVSFN